MSSTPCCPRAKEAEEAQQDDQESGPHEAIMDPVRPTKTCAEENGFSHLPAELQNPAMDIATIRPMPAESVRRIVAGQAIYDMASCTKELIDNALDAGSKNINSKLLASDKLYNFHIIIWPELAIRLP
jgi:hypothetical protein